MGNDERFVLLEAKIIIENKIWLILHLYYFMCKINLDRWQLKHKTQLSILFN